MARLESKDRAQLPDSAFAYIDSRGRRRLPIHDEAHVRNALARFSQVGFESEQARERARKRLLNAAKKFRIVPVGFITGQLQSERELAQRRAPDALPSGFVTMLMTDIEGSTALVQGLGDRYHDLIHDLRSLLRETVGRFEGHVAETRADELFAVFEGAGSALAAAVAMQRALRDRTWVDGVAVRVRAGVHSGYPTLSAPNYIGMAVHAASRICGAAHGGQILVSGATREAARRSMPEGVRLRELGPIRLRGLPEPVTLYQVTAKGLAAKFPPPRVARSGR